MHEVADFLRRHPPFDSLDEPALAAVADAAEIEHHPRGASIPSGGDAAAHIGYVVRAGEVELLAEGRLLDAVTTGEVFGLPALLTGDRVAVTARAADDVVLYRIPGDLLVAALSRPDGQRFVARPAVPRPGEGVRAAAPERPLATLVRPVVVCGADATVGEAVTQMEDVGTSSVLVRRSDGGLGVVTDQDLRRRVLAPGRGTHVTLGTVMTPDTVTAPADATVSDAVLLMLTRSIRHLPVLDAAGRVLGIVEDVDLLGAQGGDSFRLRRSLGRASDVAALQALAPGILTWTRDAAAAQLPARQVVATRSVLVHALLERLTTLAQDRIPPPASQPQVSWAALGSLGRGEDFPGSDVDTALVWDGPDDDAQPWCAALGADVMTGLRACGVTPDPNGVDVDDPRFARSVTGWRTAVRTWVHEPQVDDAVTYLSVLADARQVGEQGPGLDALTVPPDRRLLRLLARDAVRHRPPTGFVRGLVVAHSGEHRGQLDLKRGCLRPVVSLGRWAGLAAGSPARGTVERLRAGARAGLLPEPEAESLVEVMDLLMTLRLDLHLAACADGEQPQDHLDPRDLSPLMRRYLRDAFRLVASVQNRMEADLGSGRW